MNFSILLLLLIATVVLAEDACKGWSEWKNVKNANCSDICGMCGQIQQERSCLGPLNCCKGEPKRTTACGESLCRFPRRACCPGFKKKMIPHVKFYCGV
ncbi:unnamed protein product [Caenorhabditis auriculariae]|uniref:Uncharacterized protein n=1 Tax=Caenorhabditis auriculariae TaxID=2777116 RepID=A0A8S1HT39_9PELO|nr:unnamed protein product [Caenorhabditis auriculariae]